jgi:ClpP class serine protease
MNFLLNEIESMRWAMTHKSMNALWKIASREWTSADYEIFHKASLEHKKSLVADLGESLDDSETVFVNGDTGILLFDGPIIPRADSFSAMSGLVSLDSMTAAVKEFAGSSSIKRMLGLFDTPGGDVTGVSEFSDLVRSMSKPTIGFAYGSASSVGSIGVVAKFRVNKDDNSVEIVSAQSPDKRPDLSTEEGRDSIQTVVNELADVFVGDVARNMGVKKQKVLSDFGKGGEVVAGSALAAGMIDEINTLDKLMSSFQSTEPALGGGTGGGVMVKTLKEILAENPAAQAEYDALHPAKPQEPRVVPEPAAPAEPPVYNQEVSFKETVVAAKPYLTADYPNTIKILAAEVISGEKPLVALISSVASADAVREERRSSDAKNESDKMGSLESPNANTQGDDYVALAQSLRVAQGIKPRNLEVH